MLKIYNTKSRKIEEFKPLKGREVNLYACGMTVYDNAHIGHVKKYIGDDILVRVLRNAGYDVKHAMNVTDVGHLVSDEDTGIDKMEKGAKKYNLSVWDVAKKFEAQFWESMDAVGNDRPNILMHATDFIKEQINLIKILEEKGYTYRIEDGMYYDTSKFPRYFDLSRQNPNELKKGARVNFVKGKKNISDFALWKFSPKNEMRQMEWESPWGVGFPGWHIECSAMSMHAFGPTLDIHTGGIDHINIHHTNEIAQSEAATGKEFVRYWVHHNFLMVEGEKMSKSIGNIFTVNDIISRGFDPRSLRYLFLTGHYRAEMNFTWESLKAAESAYNRLLNEVIKLPLVSDIKEKPNNDFLSLFENALYDDLNTAKSLAVIWNLVKSDLEGSEKYKTLKIMDEVLGLRLFKSLASKAIEKVPQNILDLVVKRQEYRKNKDFMNADKIRIEIEKLGFEIKDTRNGAQIHKLI